MPTAPLTAERSALKAAIECYGRAAERAEKLTAARWRSLSLVGQADDAVTAAEQVLAQATAAEPGVLAARLLGEEVGEHVTVEAAIAALAQARTAFETAQKTRDALAGDDGTRDLASARIDLDGAIGACVRADPFFTAVMTAFEASQQRTEDLRALVALMPGKTIAEANRAQLVQREGSGRGVGPLRAALSALEADASAVLPTLDDLSGDDPQPAATSKAAA
jgi:hypothetical protein